MRRSLGSYRALARPVAWSAVVFLAVVVAWRSPISPVGLDRADVLVGLRDPEAAVRHYDRVSRFNPWAAQRLVALDRAATVLLVTLDDPTGARMRLRRIVEDDAISTEDRAAAWERLGDVLGTHLDQHRDAASAYRMAYETAPRDPEAGARLVASARQTVASGDLDAAHNAWDKVARKAPPLRALARVSQASLLLGRGRVSQAQDLYDEALRSDPSPELEEIATDGATTCRERLGRMASALAELEADDLSEQLKQLREAELEGLASDAL